MSQLNDINEFSFIGTLVNKRALEKASYLTLGIFRQVSNKRRIADYPRMVVYDDEVKEKEKFFKMLKERSEVELSTKVTVDDKILTLSTCLDNNQRFVVHAVLMKDE